MTSTRSKPVIVVGFFGITRSLRYTYPSIETNVLTAARQIGHVRTCAHFFDLAEISNPRSEEFGHLDPEEASLLNLDRLEVETPDACLAEYDLELLQGYGDFWEDEYTSFKNLLHQLHSLSRVTAIAQEFSPDMVVFCRPDLEYLDNLGADIKRSSRSRENSVCVPFWQSHGGLNDRFCIAKGDRAIEAYGKRKERVMSFCSMNSQPLHSEKLVDFALRETGTSVRTTSSRAQRVRMGGKVWPENFSHPLTWKSVETLTKIVPEGVVQDFLRSVIFKSEKLLLGR